MNEMNETYWEVIDKHDGYITDCGTKREDTAKKRISELVPPFNKGACIKKMRVQYKDGHTGDRFIVLVVDGEDE